MENSHSTSDVSTSKGALNKPAQQAQHGQQRKSSGGGSKLSRNGRPLPSRQHLANVHSRPAESQQQSQDSSSALAVHGQKAQFHQRPCRNSDGFMQQQQQMQMQGWHAQQQSLSPAAAVFHQEAHDQLLAAYVAAMGSPTASNVNPYFAQHMQYVRNSHDGRPQHHMSNVVIDLNGVLSRQGSGFPTSCRINELARMLPQPKFTHPRPEGPAPDTPASLLGSPPIRSNSSPVAAPPAGAAAAYDSPGLAAALATSSYACQRHFSSYWQNAHLSPASSVLPLDAWASGGGAGSPTAAAAAGGAAGDMMMPPPPPPPPPPIRTSSGPPHPSVASAGLPHGHMQRSSGGGGTGNGRSSAGGHSSVRSGSGNGSPQQMHGRRQFGSDGGAAGQRQLLQPSPSLWPGQVQQQLQQWQQHLQQQQHSPMHHMQHMHYVHVQGTGIQQQQQQKQQQQQQRSPVVSFAPACGNQHSGSNGGSNNSSPRVTHQQQQQHPLHNHQPHHQQPSRLAATTHGTLPRPSTAAAEAEGSLVATVSTAPGLPHQRGSNGGIVRHASGAASSRRPTSGGGGGAASRGAAARGSIGGASHAGNCRRSSSNGSRSTAVCPSSGRCSSGAGAVPAKADRLVAPAAAAGTRPAHVRAANWSDGGFVGCSSGGGSCNRSSGGGLHPQTWQATQHHQQQQQQQWQQQQQPGVARTGSHVKDLVQRLQQLQVQSQRQQQQLQRIRGAQAPSARTNTSVLAQNEHHHHHHHHHQQQQQRGDAGPLTAVSGGCNNGSGAAQAAQRGAAGIAAAAGSPYAGFFLEHEQQQQHQHQQQRVPAAAPVPHRGSLSARDAKEHARQQGQATNLAVRPAAPGISERLKWWERLRLQQQYNAQPYSPKAAAARRYAASKQQATANGSQAGRRGGSSSGGGSRHKRSSGGGGRGANANAHRFGTALPALNAKECRAGSTGGAAAGVAARRQPGRPAAEKSTPTGILGQVQQQRVVASMAVMQSPDVAVAGMSQVGCPGSSKMQGSSQPIKHLSASKTGSSPSAASGAGAQPHAATSTSGLVAAAVAARAAAIAATSLHQQQRQQQQQGGAVSSPMLHGPATPAAAAAAPMCRSSSSMFGPILPAIRTHQDPPVRPAAVATPNTFSSSRSSNNFNFATAAAAAGSPNPCRASPQRSMGGSTPINAAAIHGNPGGFPCFYTIKEPPGYTFRPDLAQPPPRISLSTGGIIRWSNGGGRTPRSRQGQAGGRHSSGGGRHSGGGARGSSGGARGGQRGARHSAGGARGGNGRGSWGGVQGSQGGFR